MGGFYYKQPNFDQWTGLTRIVAPENLVVAIKELRADNRWIVATRVNEDGTITF